MWNNAICRHIFYHDFSFLMELYMIVKYWLEPLDLVMYKSVIAM